MKRSLDGESKVRIDFESHGRQVSWHGFFTFFDETSNILNTQQF